MNALDKAISVLAPRMALKRAQSRILLRHLEQSKRGLFEGSSKGRRTENWVTGNKSINGSILYELPTLMARSRFLVANNAYAKRGVKAISSHVVGTGILPQVKDGSKRYERALKEWADSTHCDAEGRSDLYGLQWLVMKTVVESGECLIRKRYRKDWKRRKLPLPLQLQVIEPDYLDTAKGVGGVELDEQGRRVAYWLYEENPSDPLAKLSIKSVRVPADDILHVFETVRPGQIRGFPWLAPVILRIKDLDEFEDAQLTRQKIAACLVGVIEDQDGEGRPGAEMPELMEPGTWEVLPPGKVAKFNQPPQVTDLGYVPQQLQAVSAGLEVPYIILTNDFSRVNFSSSRMALQEFYRSIDHWRWHMLIPQFCNPIFSWFVDACQLAGKGRGSATATWVAPRREYVDPAKEIKAQIAAVRAGFTTLSETIRSMGFDPADVMNEMEQDYKDLDQRGLVVDTDARKQQKEGDKNDERSKAA